MVEQPVRAGRVEAMNPVAQGLAVHAADLGRLGAAHPLENRRQRQKPPALVVVLDRFARRRSSSAEYPSAISPLLAWRESSRLQGVRKSRLGNPPKFSQADLWYNRAQRFKGASVALATPIRQRRGIEAPHGARSPQPLQERLPRDAFR